MKLSTVVLTFGGLLLAIVLVLANYAIWTTAVGASGRWSGVLVVDGFVAICLLGTGAILKVDDK